MSGKWYHLQVNPEPWKVPPVSVGRKNGKYFPRFGRDEGLAAYQAAVAESIEDPVFFEGPIELQFYFWRNRAEYLTPQTRTHRKHEADLTNLVKATEDALQGVLFKNDKDVHHSEGFIVDQGPDVQGMMVIRIDNYDKATANIPQEVWTLIDQEQLPLFETEKKVANFYSDSVDDLI